jgi:hypothetical protein
LQKKLSALNSKSQRAELPEKLLGSRGHDPHELPPLEKMRWLKTESANQQRQSCTGQKQMLPKRTNVCPKNKCWPYKQMFDQSIHVIEISEKAPAQLQRNKIKIGRRVNFLN